MSDPAPSSPRQTEGSARHPQRSITSALRAHNRYPPKDPVLKSLWDRSRWFARVVNPFKNIDECFYMTEADEEGSDQQAERALSRLTQIERVTLQQQKADWSKIKAGIPRVADEIMGAPPDVMTQFFKFLQAAINSSRGDDTKDLKPAILDLIPQRYLTGPANELGQRSIWSSINTSARTEKWPRGFANIITARLLCPIDHLQAFDADPLGTAERLKEGSIARLDKKGVPKFPSFMYDEDMIESGKFTNGLFRGPLLTAVFTFMFVSKRVARGEEKSARKGIAEMHQMEKVDPAAICYTAIQAWVNISDMSGWFPTDHGVNLSLLYVTLRQMLEVEREKDPWVGETLDWWNNYIIKAKDTTTRKVTRDVEAPSLLEILEIERRQRLAMGS